MLHAVKGIVLRTTKYSDNSLIVNVYTDRFGLQSYLVRGTHSKTSRVKSNYFRNLMLLDMVVTKVEKHRLESIKEITGAYSYTAEFDPVKNAIFFFLNEVINKTIHEEEPNQGLFEFLVNALNLLKLKEGSVANFHLIFILKYTQYLGFFPTGNFTREKKYFDLAEGRFVQEEYKRIHHLNETMSRHFHDLMNSKFEVCEQLIITNVERKAILLALLDYYRLHKALVSDITSYLLLEQL